MRNTRAAALSRQRRSLVAPKPAKAGLVGTDRGFNPGRLAICLLPLLAGCTKPAPWQGLTAAQISEAVRQKNIGIAHLEDGQRDQAAQAFQALLKVAPNVGLGYADLAVTMLQAPEKSAEALDDARKAVDLAPEDPAVRMVLAQLLVQQRDYDGAIQQLKDAVQAHPNDARALFMLSEVYQDRAGGNRFTPERGQALQQLVQGHPDNLTAELLWANSAAGTGHAAEARAALDRAVALAGPLPSGGGPFLAAARAALQAGAAARAAGPIQTLINILAPTARQQADRAVLEGARGDPASLAVREFSPPPPASPAPPAAPIAVRFEDVTAAMGHPAAHGGSATASRCPSSPLPIASGCASRPRSTTNCRSMNGSPKRCANQRWIVG